MNIFRLTGDMLHLLAILILLYRIRKSRNCIGKSNQPTFPIRTIALIYYTLYCICSLILIYLIFACRFIMQDSGDVFTRILHKIFGSIHVFHFSLQYMHEGILYKCHCIHYLPHEIQETLLHCKY